jgi:hypothetical protein
MSGAPSVSLCPLRRPIWMAGVHPQPTNGPSAAQHFPGQEPNRRFARTMFRASRRRRTWSLRATNPHAFSITIEWLLARTGMAAVDTRRCPNDLVLCRMIYGGRPRPPARGMLSNMSSILCLILGGHHRVARACRYENKETMKAI